jgi:hypothetical protein
MLAVAGQDLHARHFEVRTDDEALHFEGKAQRKPMELAKVLVALGGRDIPVDKLIDILWPEPSEGDGHKAFDITVHRLRKLLGSDNAVQVADRRATLNPQMVWVDAWALERTLAPLIGAVNAPEPDIELLEACPASPERVPRSLPGRRDRGSLADPDPESSGGTLPAVRAPAG